MANYWVKGRRGGGEMEAAKEREGGGRRWSERRSLLYSIM